MTGNPFAVEIEVYNYSNIPGQNIKYLQGHINRKLPGSLTVNHYTVGENPERLYVILEHKDDQTENKLIALAGLQRMLEHIGCKKVNGINELLQNLCSQLTNEEKDALIKRHENSPEFKEIHEKSENQFLIELLKSTYRNQWPGIKRV